MSAASLYTKILQMSGMLKRLLDDQRGLSDELEQLGNQTQTSCPLLQSYFPSGINGSNSLSLTDVIKTMVGLLGCETYLLVGLLLAVFLLNQVSPVTKMTFSTFPTLTFLYLDISPPTRQDDRRGSHRNFSLVDSQNVAHDFCSQE